MQEFESNLKLYSSMLLRSFVVAVIILLLWVLGYMAFGDFWFVIHSRFVDFNRHEFALIHYGGMLLFKILAVCFLLCPFLAIKIIMRKQKKP